MAATLGLFWYRSHCFFVSIKLFNANWVHLYDRNRKVFTSNLAAIQRPGHEHTIVPDYKNISCGVPQGSIYTWTILFTLYSILMISIILPINFISFFAHNSNICSQEFMTTGNNCKQWTASVSGFEILPTFNWSENKQSNIKTLKIPVKYLGIW